MANINQIIQEAVHHAILKESNLSDIRQLLKDYREKNKKNKKDDKEENKEKKKQERKAEKQKKPKKKLRKTVKGGREYYDYHDYERKHQKLNKGDSDTIRDTVDTINTDIAAVARSVFPDHTEEGAQSQLRKILKNERPMTRDVASKLEKMISQGKIAGK